MMMPFEHDIFISYCQKDRLEAARLQAALEARDLKVWRDQRLLDNPEASFIGEINQALERSARVLVLWSRNSANSAWVQAEAERARMAKKIVPVALEPIGALLPFIPTPFNILPTIDVSGDGIDLEPVMRALGAEQVEGAAAGVVSLVEAHVDISKLPETFAAKLYGRDREMAKLIAAWDGAATRIFAFDAMGGAGKTALAYHFVQALKASGWRGARSVFAWSFYSQGSNEDRQTSADDFFKAAFRHFGEPDAAPPRDPREKGVQLAHLVQQSRALLILDGLEPLQYAARGAGHSSTVVGGVKDPGVKALLALLSDSNPGLCLVTTRITLAELSGAHGVAFEPLERLPLMAGIELLRDLGVEPGYPPPFSARGQMPDGPLSLRHDTEALVVAPESAGAPAPAIIRGFETADGEMPDSPPGFRHDKLRYVLPQREDFASLVPPYAPPAEYTPPVVAPESAFALIRGLQSEGGEMPDNPLAGFRHDNKLPAMPARVAKDLIEAVEELTGHALALTLIGKSLAEDHRGDIRAVHDLPSLPHLHPDDPARDPYRVMRSIEIAVARRIEEDKSGARPAECVAGRQLALLFFLGLFDRPAETALLPVVFSEAAADTLQPDPEDLVLAAKDLIQIKRSLHELVQERESGPPEWRLAEIAQEEAPLIDERDAIIEAERRVLVRRAFAGMAELTRDRRQTAEALRELARRGLIAKFDESAPFDKASVDCHPLVREYFGARLKELDRESFKAMHGRLYDHHRYAGLPPAFHDPVAYGVLALVASFPQVKDQVAAVAKQRQWPEGWKGVLPPTLLTAPWDRAENAAALIGGVAWDAAQTRFLPEGEPGMTPLFAAVAHGCAAERELEAFAEVYWPRIARGSENFAVKKLGLFGQELAALAAFFEKPFTTPSPHLSPARQGLALNLAGAYLRALGRLEDAAEPTRAAIEVSENESDWNGAASDAGNLSELLLTIGRIAGEDGAVAMGEQAVVFADRSSNAFERLKQRVKLGDALFQAGALAHGEALFRAADALQKERQPSLPRLYSLQGYHYCDFLLVRGRAAEAAARADWALGKGQIGGYSLLDTALDNLMQSRAALAEAPQAAAADYASLSNQALAALRRANADHHLPRGLLGHAEALWRCGEADAANQPLREAETIAARGPMPLFMTDAHLLRARIALSQGDLAAAKEKRDAALELIAKHGYGRAAPELALLTAEIACAENSANAEAAIAVAIKAIRGKSYFDERTGVTIDGGWWSLLPRLEPLLSADDPRLAELRAASDAYNAERDAYLAAQEAPQAPPEAEPANEWEEEDRALADPDFRRQLREILKGGNFDLDSMAVSDQREAARFFLRKMREAQQQQDQAQVPDAVVQHVFADPNAQDMLFSVMEQNGLAGEPADLPLETKRAIVAMLVEAGAITLEEALRPEVPPPPAARKKKRGWWPFG
jgi:hypothetical protein